MYDFSGPDPHVTQMRAQNHARKQVELRDRIRNHPNRFFVGDLFAIWVPLAFVFAAIIAGVIAYTLLPPVAIDWLASSDQKARWIIPAALILALAAWYARDRRKFKFYPLGEIVFGTALSVQGVFQQDVHSSTFSLVATVVAFVTGVRMIIDGLKRFDEFKTGWLFTANGLKYLWRQCKRGLRGLRYA
ncbi:hypothetical protein [Bradyrhizobium guangdongense]